MGESFLSRHPDLANEALGWDPNEVSFASNKIRKWKCPRGHVYETRVNERHRGRSCPVCSGRQIEPGFNDLKTLFPGLASEVLEIDPSSVGIASGQKISWKCKRGHVWVARIADRTQGTGCPFCSGRKVLPGFNDLATVAPEIAAEANGWDPTTVTRRSMRKQSWRCPKDHIYEASVARRTGGTGCPICAGKKILVGFNDLATTHPHVAAQACGWDPRSVTAFTNKKRNWICEKGHITETLISSKSSGKSVCAVCSGKQVQSGVNDLLTTHPLIAREAHMWDAGSLNAGSGKKRLWKCSRGHVYEAVVSNRTLGGTGCPVCAGKQVEEGFNDLLTSHPEVAFEADGWIPSSVTRGSHSKLSWKCQLGHTWKATVKDRVAGYGCPICANKEVLVGFNDLQTTHPQIAAEAFGWDPRTVTPGSGARRGWKCAEGHEWTTLVATRTQGRGCPTCAPTGFDPNLPGWLYFITHDHLEAFQIGITNNPDDRLSRHVRGGWITLEVRGPMDGSLTRDLETACLRSLRNRGAIFLNEIDVKKFDGWTEAWTKSSLNVSGIRDILTFVYEDDSQWAKRATPGLRN